MGSRSPREAGRSSSARSSRKGGAGSRRGSSPGGSGPSPARRSAERTARSVALEVVRRVTEHGAYSNLSLRSLLDESRLPRRERELATELAYGTLRKLPSLDAALSPLLRKEIEDAPSRARAALRLGAYQLLHTRIPDHAAVTETVGLVPGHARGFVNAVLRRLALDPPAPAGGSTIDALSSRTGLVPWAIRELRRLLGPEEAEAAAESLASRAPATIRANPCRLDAAGLEERLRGVGVSFARGRLAPGSLRVTGGAPPQWLKGFGQGWFAIQDEASAWVVDVLDPQPGERVADVCAGPGGKAADIACRSGSVVAADLTPHRVGLVRETGARLGVGTRLLVQDAQAPALRAGAFDRVLVDAPCSGLGAARRRPELLWRPRREDLERLGRLQLAIAEAAAGLLRPGGILLYAVCTFPLAETDRVCDRLLERVPHLRPDPFAGPDGSPVERARLWPHRHGTDAMFVARFARE